MRNNPKVSIITPCFNVEKYIAQYIESIINQNYNNIELILINDGSTDDTEKMIDEFREELFKKDITLIYFKQNNSGQAAALNKGLKIFKGKYLIWPDADDILTKNSILKRVEFLENNKEYRFVRSNGAYFTKDLKNTKRISNDKSRYKETIFYDLFLEKTYNSCGCYMMSKDLFCECYPERQIYAGVGSQNWQLLVPAASRSRCAYIDEDLYYVRVRSDSFCRKRRDFEEWQIRLNDHRELLLDAFKHSDCDIDYCSDLIKERYIRKKIKLAIEYNNRKFTQDGYRELIKSMYAKKADSILNFFTKNNFCFSLYRLWFYNKKLIIKIFRELKKLI